MILFDKLFYYDIEDQDEIHAEEWRIIFMSMISWHLVIVLVREIYFSEKVYIFKGGCCDTKNVWVWFKLVRIASLILIYTIVIHRVDKPILYTMGCTIYALIGGIFSIIVVSIVHIKLDNDLYGTIDTASKKTLKMAQDYELGTGLIF